ncbi:MAG: PIN domain-containing protein [Longimicrobiales bacterium]|nr:PIN domain-containing protein [Longimicrobiales bacterium]
MSVFADTSALYALLVRTESGHAEVSAAFEKLLAKRTPLVTSNYVLLETTALLQRRIGLPAVRDLAARIVPLFSVHWITQPLHQKALDRLVRADRRGLSLVDLTSFELMEREGITDALALEADFADAGFRVLPAGL